MFYILNYMLIVTIISVEAKIRLYVTDGPVKRIGWRIYKEELLTDQFQEPKELAYDSGSRKLFFMYMDDEIQNSGRAYINVITKQAEKIKGIAKSKATAVDSETGDVYFGSENGLFKYDPMENKAVNIGLYNMNILKLVIRNNEMYLIDANNHMLYKVMNEGRTAVKVGDMKTLMEFNVDNEKNIHYTALCGVYCIVEGHEIVKNKDLNIVYHYLVDGNKTFGVNEDGIYDINCRNGTAKRVGELNFFPRSFIYGDYGDIYYSIGNSIYRLKPIASYTVYNVYKNDYNNMIVTDK